MARSLFDAPLLEELRRDRMHAEDIAAVLSDLSRLFDREGIPFAVVGAIAMRHHGYVRHTEDIDILTTREGLQKIHERLVGRGFRPRFEGARKKFRETTRQVDLDVLVAGDFAGSEGSPLVFPDPLGPGFLEREGLRIPDLTLFLSLKLVSGIWGRRAKDLGDVQELIRANGIDDSFADKLLPELRMKYLELLENSRHQRDIE